MEGWCNINTPEAWAIGFACTMENHVAVAVLDSKRVFVQLWCAVGVTEFPKPEEVVGEAWDDVS